MLKFNYTIFCILLFYYIFYLDLDSMNNNNDIIKSKKNSIFIKYSKPRAIIQEFSALISSILHASKPPGGILL